MKHELGFNAERRTKTSKETGMRLLALLSTLYHKIQGNQKECPQSLLHQSEKAATKIVIGHQYSNPHQMFDPAFSVHQNQTTKQLTSSF